MTTKEFKIEGMTCDHCVLAVRKALSKLNPENLNVQIGKAEVTYKEDNISENELAAAIEEEGYSVIK